jgi:hypothetical protein
MKKILLVLALLLIAGCICPYLLAGSKDELELVPKTANFVLILRPSAILNDSSLSQLYNSNGQYNIQDIETTTGIDPTQMDRLVLFAQFDSLQSSPESYSGFIAHGTIDQNTVLDKMRVDNDVTQLTYGGQTIYEISPMDAPENVSYFAFLDSSTLVGGTKEAVEDSIDTSAGKMNSVLTLQNMSQTYDSFDKNSLVIVLMYVPTQLKSELSQDLNSEPAFADFTALSEIDCIGLSLVKNGDTMNINTLLTADDTASAGDVSDALSKGLLDFKGSQYVQPGTALASIVNKVDIETKGATVTVDLSTTPDELNSLIGEFSSMSGGSQGGNGAGNNNQNSQATSPPG